ncbi:NADH-quinone oxidoreductase subunit NuoI [Buchnera aphidicola (Macrosiphoniella sanborni)]|uniref:NADH-quinone oxidoreductase subunit I n=1 Tax=Buchnera aphidicola (Macrosiphoniella sanborni) TaxID=1241865 RepID=A0A4D6Y2I8_9GAMM|nr:NADH-quinone oxidoreductase subunit NuoI [Buchnera aphidicola]QCI23716.1 NADH-quinone oxidoreductase subunit NuoI [Buchnera aphidicola (Macrosiphoniella sanborni)]
MTLKNIIIGFWTQIRSLLMISANIFLKSETRLYPEEKLNLSPRYRGRIILTRTIDGQERCVACNLCAAVCPVDCISLQKDEKEEGRWYPKFFRINFSRCIFCGLCEEACPTAAIQLTPDIELADFKRKDLVYEKKDLLISGPGKYPDYNFYNFSGVHIKNKEIGDLDCESKPVNIKSLLP